MSITSVFKPEEKRKKNNNTGTRMPADRESKDTDLDKTLFKMMGP